jgi:hypothetical protein
MRVAKRRVNQLISCHSLLCQVSLLSTVPIELNLKSTQLSMHNLSNPVLDHNRLSLLHIEAALADKDTVLEVLVAFVAGLSRNIS